MCIYFPYFIATLADNSPRTRKIFGFGCAPDYEPREALSSNKYTKSILTKVVNAKKHRKHNIQQTEHT